jgi:hypothetical protein
MSQCASSTTVIVIKEVQNKNPRCNENITKEAETSILLICKINLFTQVPVNSFQSPKDFMFFLIISRNTLTDTFRGELYSSP